MTPNKLSEYKLPAAVSIDIVNQKAYSLFDFVTWMHLFRLLQIARTKSPEFLFLLCAFFYTYETNHGIWIVICSVLCRA